MYQSRPKEDIPYLLFAMLSRESFENFDWVFGQNPPGTPGASPRAAHCLLEQQLCITIIRTENLEANILEFVLQD
jgi:hypothetical protein